MNPHPFLNPEEHPNWDELTADKVRVDLSLALEQAEENLEKIRKLSPGELNFENTVKALERANYRLNQAWGLVTHLDSVCNSAEMREAHNDMLPAVSAFEAKVFLDSKLWHIIQEFARSEDAKSLPPIDSRLLQETIRDFQDAGSDLPIEKRKRLEEISGELAKVTQTFSEHVLDGTNAWHLTVREEVKLLGLPENAKAAARQTALEKLGEEDGKDAWVFNLQAPSMLPVMQYLEDDEIRKKVWSASNDLCLEEPYANEPLIHKILKLRQEKAEILGKSDFAEVLLSRRMAGSGEKAENFVDDLMRKALPFFHKENQELEEFMADKTGRPIGLLEPWEVGLWSEKLKKERYDFDEEDLRPFFPIHNVLEGMFQLASQVFGLRIEERSTSFENSTNWIEGNENEPVSVWHPEVRFYDLFDDSSSSHLGAFYADWHPRASKRGGAWMNFLRTAEPEDENPRGPHLGLICGNLTAPTPESPALLTHFEVETIFHEFGHLLHHLCGEVVHRSLNGVNVAWDFVELPSQIMENWCWERESLDLFARHYQTGHTIPEELLQKMLRARNFFQGNTTMRQMTFSKLDLFLHRAWSKECPNDLENALQNELKSFLPRRKSPARTIVLRFSHLFSSPVGYAAAYYSYKWAEVLDADAFTRFKKEGILNPKTGKEFRKHILSQGNSLPPGQLFHNFMGRGPDVQALLTRSGLA